MLRHTLVSLVCLCGETRTPVVLVPNQVPDRLGYAQMTHLPSRVTEAPREGRQVTRR